MLEPSNGTVEPVGQAPLGASGMEIRIPSAPGENPEPTNTNKEEPASGEENYEDVDFMDLKTVPKPLQKAAKKLQSTFTKAMQVGKMAKESQPEVETPPNPEFEDSKAKVRAYMETPEGAALKDVFDSMIADKLGDIPQEVTRQRVDREVAQVVENYGKDVITDNYDAIEEVARANPNVPLDFVVSNVLFAKAKELGAEEYKAKIVRKNTFSSPAPNNSSNVVTTKDAATWDEAFEAAKKELGY